MPASLTWGGVSVETFYQPARAIGGDFGLVAERADRLNILMCDVSGHGIGSALLANRIYAETISQVELGAELITMMRHLNRFVLRYLGSPEFYLTLAAAHLKRDGCVLEFAGAGHPPAMIARPGDSLRLLESQSALLGILEDAVKGKPTKASFLYERLEAEDSLFSCFHYKSNAAHCLNQFFGKSVINLPTKPADVNVDNVI